MRKPLFCSSIRVEDMTSPSQNFDVVGESRVERAYKRLSAPLTKKIISADRIFGIPLVELVHNNSGDQDVPLVVSTICDYIECHGFHHEGLFRINGSARAIEKLRTSFERTGATDANLEDVGDVMAAAGLLKQFLRGLPEPVIVNALHEQFVQAFKDHHQDSEECIRQLKKLVEQLPLENFNLLKYLMGFLVKVTNAEEYNRMNSNALGIIFGPNLFRVPDGDEGLREQAVTNQIVTKFIKDYAAIFEADSAATPERMAPSGEVSKTFASAVPVRMPLKVQCRQTQAKMDVDYAVQNSAHAKGSTVIEPCISKVESARKGVKSMTTSEDSLPLPRLEIENQENNLVEMTISKTVNKHLYGDFDSSDANDAPRPPPRIKHKKMDLSPDGAAMSKLARSNAEDASGKRDESLSVPPSFTFSKCNSHENEGLNDGSKAAGEIVSAKLDDHLENKTESVSSGGPAYRPDHPLTPLNIDTSSHATPDLRKKDWGRHHDSEIDASEARRSMERLQYRSTSSKNRRMSSLRSSRRCLSMDVAQRGNGDESVKENEGIKSTKGGQKHFQKRSSSISHIDSPSDAPDDDGMQGAAMAKPRLWLLDLHAAAAAGVDDGASPSSASKPCIPPLDFSILHEHGDGSDPIPTNQLRASWPFTHQQQNGDDDVMLSPRTSSLEKKSSFVTDHNIPPSPPVEQEASRKSSITMKDEETIETSFKVLNKRISILKRKIKKFEDGFEDEFGYRPSHAEKMCRSDIKKYLTDLVKVRKELKQLKENTRMASVANSGMLTTCQIESPVVEDQAVSGPVQYTLLGSKHSLPSYPTMKESLDDMLFKLSDDRLVANRPDELESMNRQQILDEKLAMQKSLLQFESVHGHPSTKFEKELMKPIYERYRSVKRLAAKSGSPKLKESSMELQPILEHVTMDFTQASPKHNQHPEDVVEQEMEHSADENVQPLVNSLSELEGTPLPVSDMKKGKKKKHAPHIESCNLHELSLEELMEQEWKVRCEKKRLRRILKEFEDEFQKQTGRKAQREDRSSMDSVYLDYKQVKAKLKLLEALLTKHEHHYTI